MVGCDEWRTLLWGKFTEIYFGWLNPLSFTLWGSSFAVIFVGRAFLGARLDETLLDSLALGTILDIIILTVGWR